MIANYPQNGFYYPSSQPIPSSPPIRPSYYMSRNTASSDGPYCVVPYYSYQVLPVYYMPMTYKRPVSLTSSSSPEDYMPSDIDLSKGWEYQQESDPQFEPEDISPNNYMNPPYTDWERQDDISSQDLSPQHSASPLSVSELENRLEDVELNYQEADPLQELPAVYKHVESVVYDRNKILKLKQLRSDNEVRETLDQIDSTCIQTLFSSTSTFSECADVIIYKNDFTVPALIAIFEELIEEWSVESYQAPWFVFRVLIFVRYKKGDNFNSTLVTNGKLVYEHYIKQSHQFLQARIRNACLCALEDEESSLKFSGSYDEFVSLLPES
ncbi:hypothetical protein LOD99_1006 [Oopsacas minuta]|uniref:Uncharacterized protein n=1 Tax=Oopsacas minuta TaxID=111878 RepID=A0AAV7K1X4_9METZ|nr:hypothetical protein LOD99_1006 [Oopsacas minuta]